jgi:large subunit ribosomal protein L9
MRVPGIVGLEVRSCKQWNVAAKHEVEKSEIRMPDGPIKTTGDHEITIALHHDVTVQIMVSVTAEEA